MTNNVVSTSGRAGQLVRVLSSQGVEMTGFHAAAAPDAPLLLCLHGLSGSMDTSFVFDFLAHADMAECHILSVACSGHGNISMARAGDPLAYRLGGSAFEFFEDCVADLAAWMDYAAAHTSGPIILLGHSLGASKVVHYLAQSADARVAGLVLASAPDLKGAFVALHGQPRFEAFMAEAREKVAQGRGRSLMGEACVIGLLRQRVSAQTLLDRFEDGSAADTFDFYERNAAMAFRALNAVTVPVLATYGRRGEIVGPGGVTAALELLRRHAGRAASFEGVVVSGNHWYFGAEREVAEHLMGWLRATGLAPAVQGEQA